MSGEEAEEAFEARSWTWEGGGANMASGAFYRRNRIHPEGSASRLGAPFGFLKGAGGLGFFRRGLLQLLSALFLELSLS